MQQYSVIIIDDEKLAREIIKKYLTGFPQLKLEAECSNGFEGIKKINEVKPDLVFLDIQMPRITGFEMLELLEDPPVIVFTTAYDQYAIKAFEVNAADYLLKPYSTQRFSEAVNKAVLRLQNRSEQKLINDALVNDKKPEPLSRIVVKEGNNISVVDVENILFFEAMDDYICIYTDESKHLYKKPLKFYEANLDENLFVRIHRSYLVNLKKIKRIELAGKETYSVVLITNKKLTVSKSGYDLLKTKLN